jgi:hypothetical protein
MTDNATTSDTTEAQAAEFTQEQLDKIWASLDETFKGAINAINKQINEHNSNVALIKSAKEQDTTKLLHEIREQNPGNDPKLAKFNAEIEKLDERRENLIKQAAEIAKQYLPKAVTEEDVTKAQEATKISSPAIRTAIKSLEDFEALIKPMGLALTPFVKPLQTTRGLALTGSKSSGGGSIWRPRFSDITLNGKSIAAKVKGQDGTEKMKATLGFLSTALNKATQSSSYTTQKLQEVYAEAITKAGGTKENPPETVTFTIQHEYEIEGGTETANFEVVAKR